MKPGEKTISLEEYADFCVSGKSTGYTISYLNQILHFHGFRKLHKSPKKVVGEAVKALDLLDLTRSTLKQTGIESSSASLTLDEVVTDIEALKWQECCLTSLEVINSDEVTRSVTKPRQKLSKRKRESLRKLLCFDEEDDGERKKKMKKRTKKEKEKESGRRTVSECHYALFRNSNQALRAVRKRS